MKYSIAFTALFSVASTATAFEIDIGTPDIEQMKGYYVVGDLTVGTRARVSDPCQENRQLFIFDSERVDPGGDFIATLKPNGNFSLEFAPVNYKGEPRTTLYGIMRPIVFPLCDLDRLLGATGELIEVDDVDGFTSYSDWAQSVLRRFPLAE